MPTAELILKCPLGHCFTVRWLLIEHAVQVPKDEWCPDCGLPGKLIRAEMGE